MGLFDQILSDYGVAPDSAPASAQPRVAPKAGAGMFDDILADYGVASIRPPSQAEAPRLGAIGRGLETLKQQAEVGRFLAGGDPEAAARGIAASETAKRASPPPQEVIDFMQSKGLWETLGRFAEAPATITGTLLGENLPQQAAPVGLGAAGFAAGSLLPGPGNIAGMAAGVGTGSALVEGTAKFIEGLADAGVDLADDKAVARALQDRELVNKILTEKAIPKAAVVGAFDALTAGLAGRVLGLGGKAARDLSARQVVGRGLGELGVQAAGGAAGEALGEIAAGQTPTWPNVLAEAGLEIPGGAFEIAGGVYGRRSAQPAPQAAVPEAGAIGAEPLPAAGPAQSGTPPAGTGIADILGEGFTATDIAAAAAEPNPTEAQKAAGNYRKGHLAWNGLDITIETPRGAERSGTAPNGTPWSVTMPEHYGYVKRTTGRDGDQVDIYMGRDETSPRVFVIDQVEPATRRFDEHKVMLGFRSPIEARRAYAAAFSDGSGPMRIGGITEMSVDRFKDWLQGDTTKPAVALEQPIAEAPAAPPAGHDAGSVAAVPPPAAGVSTPPPGVAPGPQITPAQRTIDVQTPKLLGKPRKKAALFKDRPANIVEFLADSGGIRDEQGELRSMDAQKWFGPGIGTLVRPKGRSLDMAREAAVEAGYLKADATVTDLLRAIDDTLGGRPVFSAAETDKVMAWRDRVAAETAEPERDAMERRAVGLGITVADDWTDAELLAEIHEREAIQAEDVDATADRYDAEFDALLPAELRPAGIQAAEGVPFDDAVTGTEDRPGPPAARPAPAGTGEAGPGAGPEAAAGRRDPEQDRGAGAAPESGAAGPEPAPPRPEPARAEPVAAPRGEPAGQQPRQARQEAPATEVTALDQQFALAGGERSAVQAAQSREAEGRGKIRPRAEQREADRGLFAPKADDRQGDLLSVAAPEKHRPGPSESAPATVPTSSAMPADIAPKPDDLEFYLARRAHEGTSFSPEERARQEQEDYVRDITSLYEAVAEMAKTDAQKAVLAEEIKRYKVDFLNRYGAKLAAQARVISPMIAGPAKFPVARNQKRMETERRRLDEFFEWRKKARAAVFRAVRDARSSGQVAEDAWSELRKDIDRSLSYFDDPNYNRGAFTDSIAGKLSRLAANGETDLVRRALDHIRKRQEGRTKPFFTDRHSIWTLAEKSEAIAAQPKPEGEETIAEYAGARIVNNRDAERIQIFFDTMPGPEIRNDLKSAGWRWSPTNDAWQRQNTNAGISSAQQIVGKHFQPRATPDEPVFQKGKPAAVLTGTELGPAREQRLAGGLTGTTTGEFEARRNQIERAIRRAAAERAPSLSVELFDRLSAEHEGRRRAVNAAYVPLSGHIAYIALSSPNPLASLTHEIVHFLRRAGFFSDREWAVLENRATASWRQDFDIDARYAGLSETEQLEEAIAEAAAAWEAGTLQLPPGFRRIFAAIRKFFTRTKNALAGMGFQTAEDVLQRVHSGEVGRRGAGAVTAGQAAAMQAPKPAAPVTEPTPQGDQYVIPGAEKIGDRELAERKMAAAGTTKKPQAGLEDLPLFAGPDRQTALKFQEVAAARAGTVRTAAMRELFGDVFDKAAGIFRPIGNLPQDQAYLGKRYRALGKVARVDEIARQVYDAFAKADAAGKTQVYDYLTTAGARAEAIADARLRSNAVRLKGLINRIGDELASRGLIPPESRAKYRDAYLPRIYLKHILDLDRGGEGGKTLSAQGWRKARKDIPEDIRMLVLGEIQDPAFLGAKGVGIPLRDLAIMDFLEEVAANPAWAFADGIAAWQGRKVSPFWLRTEAARVREQAQYYPEPQHRTDALDLAARMDAAAKPALDALTAVPDRFVQLPDNPRYGMLRGLYVRKEIHDDLVGTIKFISGDRSFAEQIFEVGGYGTKATQWWKLAKVTLNPPSQIRNLVSNAVLLNLSGVPLWRIPGRLIEAVQDIRQNGRFWRVAKQYGVNATGFASTELPRIEREFLDLKAKGGGWLWQMNRLAQILASKASDVYQASEALFKTAKIIDAVRRQGLSEEAAALEAQKWLFDYSLVPPSVRYLRNSPFGVPFLSFYFKALPRMVETAATKPWRFLPYAAIPYALAAAIEADYDVDDDDLDRLYKALPKWLQERGSAYILPFKDAKGRWQVADIGYFFPWAAYVGAARDVGRGDIVPAMDGFGLGGAPVLSLIAALKTNIDPFTQQPIANEFDPPGRRLRDVMLYLWRLSAPTFVTDKGFAGHIWDAANAIPKRSGEPGLTVDQAMLRLVGLNIYPIEPERTRAENIKRMRFEIAQIRGRMNSALRDRSLDPEQRASAREAYIGEIRRRLEALRSYAEGSGIHPNLRTAP